MLLSARPSMFLWGQTGIPMNGLTNSWMCLLLGGAEGRVPPFDKADKPSFDKAALPCWLGAAPPHSSISRALLGVFTACPVTGSWDCLAPKCLILWTSGLGPEWVPRAAASGLGYLLYVAVQMLFLSNQSDLSELLASEGPRP